MVKIFFVWFCLQFLVFPLKAQEGFIQAYDLDGTWMTFQRILLVDDTLIILGTKKSNNEPSGALFFCKMDTMGNILDYKTHYDSSGNTFDFFEETEIIKTNDGGYAMVGRIFPTNTTCLVKLDVNGNLEFARQYVDSTSEFTYHYNLVEFERGYITTGIKYFGSVNSWDTFIRRIDKLGNLVWETHYGQITLGDVLRGLNKLNENEFLVSGRTFIPFASSAANVWEIPKAIIVDSLGVIISEWEGEKQYYGNSATYFDQLYPSTDGDWVHIGARSTIFSSGDVAFQSEIVKRDNNYNVIWSSVFGQPTSSQNRFYDLAPSPDGGWVAAGRYFTETTTPSSFAPYWGGWLGKVDANGDSLWSRVDTFFYDQQLGSWDGLSSLVVLPSGSIVACGSGLTSMPAKHFGWVIKVDKNGCMIPGCNPSLDAVNLTSLINDFMIYPNPTSDLIHIEGKNDFSLRLYDNNGKVVIHKEKNYQESELDVRNLPSGIYYLQIKNNNRMLTKKIVKQ